MELSSINYLAVVVAALASFLIGGLWFSPGLFGKAWMEENGLSEDDVKGNMGLIYGLTFVLYLIIAFLLDGFLGSDATLMSGLAHGAIVGIGWVSTSTGVTYLFERKSTRLFLINAGYHTVGFIVLGAILGLWN